MPWRIRGHETEGDFADELECAARAWAISARVDPKKARDEIYYVEPRQAGPGWPDHVEPVPLETHTTPGRSYVATMRVSRSLLASHRYPGELLDDAFMHACRDVERTLSREMGWDGTVTRYDEIDVEHDQVVVAAKGVVKPMIWMDGAPF